MKFIFENEKMWLNQGSEDFAIESIQIFIHKILRFLLLCQIID